VFVLALHLSFPSYVHHAVGLSTQLAVLYITNGDESAMNSPEDQYKNRAKFCKMPNLMRSSCDSPLFVRVGVLLVY
jgi:hypothetical protein